ncbi:MAG TPA: endo-1,4-beta-xylanase [Phycisphaeraceae bacterium]
MMPRVLCILALACLGLMIWPAQCAFAAADEPFLDGAWVQATQQRIEQVRQTPLRLIVLDADGQPVPGATVRIEQQRHDFVIGLVLGSNEAALPEALGTDEPVWRCFNAVSLDRLTDWARLAPSPDAEPAWTPLDEIVEQAKRRGLVVRWGELIHSDPGRNPPWVGVLRGQGLRDALEEHVHEVLSRYGWAVDQFDLYTRSFQHRFIERELGEPMLRYLYESAKAQAPRAAMAIRFENALGGGRTPELVQIVTALRQGAVPLDQVSLDEHIARPLVQAPLERALTWLEQIELEVVLADLEVGGASEAAAAINLETLLRTLMAQPVVGGVWFGAVRPAGAAVPDASLLDGQGKPTRLGRLVDRLFHELWWTSVDAVTDELGNVRTRVFAGTHRIAAILPGGTLVHTLVYLPRQEEERVVILQPLTTPPADTQPAPESSPGA